MIHHQPVADITLAVADNQRADGPVLLLVHGFPLDRTMWDAQAAALDPNCRMIAPDLRGYGQSTLGDVGDPPAAPMERYADDLIGLLDALEVSQPVVFVGFSMGGYIGWQFLRRCPQRVRALVLCDTRAAADTADASAMRLKMARHVDDWGAERVAEVMIPKLFAQSSIDALHPMVAHTREVISQTNPTAIAAAQRGMAARPDMTPLLPGITAPTLAIVGEQDTLSPPAEVRGITDAIPNAELAVIPAAGHMSPVEQPELVNAALLRFVARICEP